MQILITGSDGFMGRNLRAALAERAGAREDTLFCVDVRSDKEELRAAAEKADFVFHLAGVNRPENPEEFMQGNGGFTDELLALLEGAKKPPVLLSSSTQAALDNPYGISKRAAEASVRGYGSRLGVPVYIYRMTNAFGKWSRPNYNSAVATFCHQAARGLPITVNDPDAPLRLIYIDDIVTEFLRALDGSPTREGDFCVVRPEYALTVGELARRVASFRDARDSLDLPEPAGPLTRALFATYLSFLPSDDFARSPVAHADERGSFTELLHMGAHGQLSVNVSRPRVTKGEHWHHTKHEKFIVLSGEGVIRLRKVGDGTVISYPVSGSAPQVVDIPPGYTHCLENLGDTDMITLMWANERFDPDAPDTIRLPVKPEKGDA